MAPNYWAVVCPESNVPGLWGIWLKERCVAIGWPPDKHHLEGTTGDARWRNTKSPTKKIKTGDIVIPYLKNYRFGTPGKVVQIDIGDKQWDETVPRGNGKWRLGRRIKVEWVQGKFPPVGTVAVVPKNMRKATGEVRQTLETV